MEPAAPETGNPPSLFPEQVTGSAGSAASVQAVPEAIPLKERAGFWRRAVAFTIDLTLLEWITLLFIWIGAAAEDLALARTVAEDLSGSLLEWTAWHAGLSFFLFVVYFSFFTFYGGRTPGKMALGIRVMTTDGGSPSWARALLRTLGYTVSFFTLGLGFLLAAFPPAKRALHDVIAGTVVVKVQ